MRKKENENGKGPFSLCLPSAAADVVTQIRYLTSP